MAARKKKEEVTEVKNEGQAVKADLDVCVPLEKKGPTVTKLSNGTIREDY